jgi:hypothetical protein
MRRPACAWTCAAVGCLIGLSTVAPLSLAGSPQEGVSPQHGGVRTEFVYHYYSEGAGDGEIPSGDFLYLYGPHHTQCKGRVAKGQVGDGRGRQTLVLGFRYGDRGPRGNTYFFLPQRNAGYDNRKPRPLKQWCRGVYRGLIKFVDEGEDQPTSYTTTHRFAFRVR